MKTLYMKKYAFSMLYVMRNQVRNEHQVGEIIILNKYHLYFISLSDVTMFYEIFVRKNTQKIQNE